MLTEKDERRFWGKVALPSPETGCMEWLASTRNGYGQFAMKPKTEYAHRVSYQHWVGPIPERMHLDHLCRNTICVRPDHLEVVTPSENATRGVGPQVTRALYNAQKYCKYGHSYTEENTFRDGRGRRGCRACRKEASRRHYERKKGGRT